MPAKFRHPANGYTETVSDLTWLWVLLFGCIYFAVKGVWRHFVAGLILAVLTAGLSWFVYPFFAHRIVKTHYLRMGWERVRRAKPAESPRTDPAGDGAGIWSERLAHSLRLPEWAAVLCVTLLVAVALALVLVVIVETSR